MIKEKETQNTLKEQNAHTNTHTYRHTHTHTGTQARIRDFENYTLFAFEHGTEKHNQYKDMHASKEKTTTRNHRA